MAATTTPSFALDGKRALVTGAGRGIGRAAADALAAFGAHVTLVARSGDEIEAASEAIRANGGSADALAVDVTDLESFAAAVEARDSYDILVNNAGINRVAPFLEVEIADFDLVMNLNLRASFFAAQSVARRMRAAGRGGSIINMSSQMGHVGAATRSVYCASKWAMEGMTKAMAIDLAPFAIRVNTIGPTFIETPLASRFLSDEAFRADVLRRIKLGRVGQVQDLTGAIVFLASDASSLMTGSSLVVDGGWTAD